MSDHSKGTWDLRRDLFDEPQTGCARFVIYRREDLHVLAETLSRGGLATRAEILANGRILAGAEEAYRLIEWMGEWFKRGEEPLHKRMLLDEGLTLEEAVKRYLEFVTLTAGRAGGVARG